MIFTRFRTSLVIVAASLLISSCVFSKGSPRSTGPEDAGSDISTPRDTSQPELDDGLPPVVDSGADMRVRDIGLSDSSSPPDMAGPDLGYGVSCDEDPPAPRCDLSPSEANWGPASIVAEIRLADGDCCFDHTGDGVNDNELGNMLFAFSESDSQDAIDSQIASGNFVLLLEYPGLMDKTNDDTFRTYAYRGEGPVPPDSNTNEVSVAREDLAEGAFAAHRFVESNLSGGDISAREGEVWLPLPLPGFADLQVPVVDARVELSVNTAGTGLPQPGVKADGIIGGAVLATGLFGALSAEAESQCPCLELSDAGPYISEDGACNPNLSSNAGNCSMLCADVAAACGEYAGFLNDLDVAIGGGDPNAMSLGYEFSVAPAEITGAR